MQKESRLPHHGVPAPASEPIEVRGFLYFISMFLFVLTCIAIPISIPYLRHDPVTWDLTLLFAGLTGTAAGATAGIIMVVFGAVLSRRYLLAAGLIIGVVSFLLLALVLGWAIHKDELPQTSLVPTSARNIITSHSVPTGLI